MRSLNIDYDMEPSIAHKYNASVVKECVKPNAKILDIGCWTGQLYSALTGTQYDYTGIDISQEAINLAKKKYRNASWIVSDALKLPFAKHSFDAILLFEVLEHLGDNEQSCLNELGRVLKKGGVLILSTPSHNLFSILSDPAFFLQNHKHYKEVELKKFLEKDYIIEKKWLKGNIIYVSMYLTQMFFKHFIKSTIPTSFQKKWEREAFKEFNTKNGFLGYYIIAKRK